MSRTSPQQQIALLMEHMDPLAGSNLGGPPSVRAARVPADPPTSNVTDGRSNRQQTELRSCSAGSCAHNVDGRSCSLAHIEVNRSGGCADYEAEADDYEGREDEQTIVGISTVMPAALDLPTALGR